MGYLNTVQDSIVINLSCLRVYLFVQISELLLWTLSAHACLIRVYSSLPFTASSEVYKPCLFAAAVRSVQSVKRASPTSPGILNNIFGSADPPHFFSPHFVNLQFCRTVLTLSFMNGPPLLWLMPHGFFFFFHFEFISFSFSDVFRKTGGEVLRNGKLQGPS